MSTLLVAELLVEELGHVGIGLFGFGEAYVIPEGVGEAFEDDELGVVAAAEKGPVEDGCTAEEEVAAAGDEEGWRHVVEIGVEGRKDGVFGVGGAEVFGIERPLRDDGKGAGESAEAVHGHGVAGLAEVAEA